ncbi:MAG: hypothetical protein JSW53_00210 [Candidatus Bathyarchaeota archaeon]|nr:MAG: hypothetical protein JSW53_00210 [Candidatus Bathyarchaeota archaeon]
MNALGVERRGKIRMDATEVIGGIFLLMIGVLTTAPLPFDGWFYESFPEFAATALAGGIFLILLGSYLAIAGFKSKEEASRMETVGAICLFISFIILLAAFVAEDGVGAGVSAIAGWAFLVVGVGTVLVGRRRAKNQDT